MKKRVIAAGLLVLSALCGGFVIYRKAPGWIQEKIEAQLQKKHDCVFEVETMEFSTEDFCFHGIAYASKEPDWKCRYICSLKGYIYDTWACLHAAMTRAEQIASDLPEEDTVFAFCADSGIQVDGNDPDFDDILYLYPEETFRFIILTPNDVSEIYEQIDSFLEGTGRLEGELIICNMSDAEISYVERTCAQEPLEESTFESMTSAYEVYRIPFGS